MEEKLKKLHETLLEIIPYEWDYIEVVYWGWKSSRKVYKGETGVFDGPEGWDNKKKYRQEELQINNAINSVLGTMPDEDGNTNYVFRLYKNGEMKIHPGKEVEKDLGYWDSVLLHKYFDRPFYTEIEKAEWEKYLKLYDENGNRKVKRKRAAKLELSPELEEWFGKSDEERREMEKLFCGFVLYSRKKMEADWKSWREFDDDDGLNNSLYYTSKPAGTIKLRYSYAKWIPIAHDGAGNYVGVDLSPGKKGTAGQVINFGRDENDKWVFAPSLSEFLQLLKDKQDTISEYRHLIDALKSI